MLATCRPVDILCWDRRDDRRAELLEFYSGVTLWQAAKWLGVLEDTDMCDKDVVVMKFMRMTNMATGLQCGVSRMRCLERSEPVKLGCVLEMSEASWATVRLEQSTQRRGA